MKVSFLIFSTVLSFPAAALAAVCVENNTMKCDALGYTESSCKYGGIACPFDTSRWSCTQWTCEDGRYKSKAGINDNCLEVEYKDMTCYDCVATVEEDICSAYDEQTLVEALQCDDCPVITVLNDITITDKLPDLKEGQTLKAADGQTYTITVNPSGDIQTSDPEFEISQGGQTMKVKLSQLLGTELGIILTTAAGSRIDNIHFDVAATHNVDAVIVPLGDTTFNNLSIVIDGKDEESEQMVSAGVLLFNPGGKIAFEGDTYIEMKNIKGRQMVAGVFDIIPSPEMAATVTTDNIDIIQENIGGGNLVGLVLNLLNVTGDVTMVQSNNKDGVIEGFQINNATIEGNIEITQNNNDSGNGELRGIWQGGITMTKANAKILINQSNNQSEFMSSKGLMSSVKALADGVEIVINQDSNSNSTGIMSNDTVTIENAALTINQTASATVYGIDASSISFIGDLPVTINQNNNSKGRIYGINSAVTSDGKAVLTINQTNNIVRGVLEGIDGNPTFADIRIVQENNTKDKSLSNPTYNITAIDTDELRSDNIDIRQIGNDFGGNLTGINSNDSLAGVIKIEQKDNTNDLGSITSYPTVYGIVASGNFSADNVEIIQSGYNHYQNSNTLRIEGFWKAANGEDVHVGDISVTQTDWNISYNSSDNTYILGINGGNYDNAVVTQNNIVFEHPTLSTKLCLYRLSALATYTTNGRLPVANSTIINQGQYANDETMCQYVIYGGMDLNQLIANRQCGDLAYGNNYTIVDLTDNYTPCE